MSRGWKHSNMQVGEELRVPDDFFQSQEGKFRLISSRYVGETETGIRILMEFRPGFASEHMKSYERFVDWAAIWCGMVQIKRQDGSPLRAERKVPHPMQRF